MPVRWRGGAVHPKSWLHPTRRRPASCPLRLCSSTPVRAGGACPRARLQVMTRLGSTLKESLLKRIGFLLTRHRLVACFRHWSVQSVSSRTLRRVLLHMRSKQLGRAWKRWGVHSWQAEVERTKVEGEEMLVLADTQHRAATMKRVLNFMSHRERRDAWLQWTHRTCMLQQAELKAMHLATVHEIKESHAKSMVHHTILVMARCTLTEAWRRWCSYTSRQAVLHRLIGLLCGRRHLRAFKHWRDFVAHQRLLAANGRHTEEMRGASESLAAAQLKGVLLCMQRHGQRLAWLRWKLAWRQPLLLRRCVGRLRHHSVRLGWAAWHLRTISARGQLCGLYSRRVPAPPPKYSSCAANSTNESAENGGGAEHHIG